MSTTSELGMRDLHADRRRQPVAHRAQAARGHPAVRLLEMEVLGGPHLVLADLGGDVDVAASGQFVKPANGVLRLDDRIGVAKIERPARAPVVDRLPPLGERGRVGLQRVGAPQPHHVLEHVRAVADDAEVDLDVLVDRGRIDVDVDFLAVRREGVEATGDAVVEARADADHQIAIMHRVVGLERAVHAEHAQPLLVGRGIGAQAHQRRGDGKSGQAHQFAQQRRSVRAGIDDAAAGVEDRLLRLAHHVDRAPDAVDVALDLRLIGLVLDLARERIGAGSELHVLGDVDDDGAGPAVRSDVEGLMQNARQILDAAHEVIVLGAIAGDAGRVAFLERVRADQMRRHLPGDADERDRVHERVGEASDRIGRARPGGDEQHADPAGRAGVAFGRVRGALFMAHENMAERILAENGVVDRQDRAAGIAEDEVDSLVLQRFDDHLRAGHLFRHCDPPFVSSFFGSRFGPWRGKPDSRQQKRPARGLGHAPVAGSGS